MTLERTDAGRAARPESPDIGEALRVRRHELGWSLRDLADRLGCSPSLISQIERGRANPSVSTLYSIVQALDVSLDELLFNERRATATEPPPGGPIQRGKERHRIRLASGVLWERLTTVSEPGVEFLHVTYEVGGASSPPMPSSVTPGTSGATSSPARSRSRSDSASTSSNRATRSRWTR